MDGFPQQFLKVWENTTKPFILGEPWKLVPILFQQYGCFFSIRFPSCGILHHMGNALVSPSISYRTRNATKLIVWGEPGKLVLILFPYYGRFFSIRFPFYGMLHHMGNACVFSLISHNMGTNSQTHRMGKVWEIGSRIYPTKPTVCGEPRKLVLILFPQYGCFFPMKFTSYGILHNM